MPLWATFQYHTASSGVLTETTAELAAALTLAAARRVVEADSFIRQGHYKGWLPDLFVGQLLQVCKPACRTAGRNIFNRTKAF